MEMKILHPVYKILISYLYDCVQVDHFERVPLFSHTGYCQFDSIPEI